MAQGITIKGKTPAGQNVEVQVDANGVVQVALVGGGGGGGTTYSRPTNAFNLTQFDDTSSALYEYYSYTDKDGNWYIKRLTVATNLFEYTVPVATSYTTGWTNRASLTYVDYGTAF